MFIKRIPPSLTEVQNYHSFQLALNALYKKLSDPEPDDVPENNPFDPVESRVEHAFYHNMVHHKARALEIHEVFQLTEDTIEQYIRDDIRYGHEIAVSELDPDHDQSIGSDAYLDRILSYREKYPDMTFDQAHVHYLRNSNTLLMQQKLDSILPLISRWAVNSKDEHEQNIQDIAYVVDRRLGHETPYLYMPEKDTSRSLHLSMPSDITHKEDDADRLLQNFAKKLGL